jgi:tryptophan-rich sensory protein
MTSKWRERLYSPSWSTGERVYVIVLWTIILASIVVLGVLGFVLYDSLQTGAAAPTDAP